MKKLLSFVIACLMILSCMPLMVGAEDVTYQAKTYTDADKAWYDNDTTASTFTISNAEELAYFISLVASNSFINKEIKLDADIVWNYGTASENGFTPDASKQGNVVYKWNPSTKNFEGTFNGDGHTISGLYISETASARGFFGVIKNATVKNVSFENSYFSVSGTYKNMGFVCGTSWGSSTFENVSVDAYQMHSTNSTHANIGGICGFLASSSNATTTFTNCTVSGKVANTDTSAGGVVGGFLGACRTGVVVNMTNCVNYAAVSGRAEIAGLVARFAGKGTITSCYSIGKVSASSNGTWAASLVYARMNNDGTKGTIPTTHDACNLITFDNCYRYTASNTYPVVIHHSEPGFKLSINGTAYAYHGGTSPAPTSNYSWANPIMGKFTEMTFAAAATGVVAMEGVQTSLATDKFNARLVASVILPADQSVTEANVTAVGFEVAKLNDYTAAAEGAVKTVDCKCVYQSITSNFGMDTLSAKDDFGADYIGTLVIKGIPASGAQTLVARPYYKTADGVVYGGYILITFIGGAVVAVASV